MEKGGKINLSRLRREDIKKRGLKFLVLSIRFISLGLVFDFGISFLKYYIFS